jgi:hypothetical protein
MTVPESPHTQAEALFLRAAARLAYLVGAGAEVCAHCAVKAMGLESRHEEEHAAATVALEELCDKVALSMAFGPLEEVES